MGNHPDVHPPMSLDMDGFLAFVTQDLPPDVAFEGVQILYDAPGQPYRVYLRSSVANRRVTGHGDTFALALADAQARL